MPISISGKFTDETKRNEETTYVYYYRDPRSTLANDISPLITEIFYH